VTAAAFFDLDRTLIRRSSALAPAGAVRARRHLVRRLVSRIERRRASDQGVDCIRVTTNWVRHVRTREAVGIEASTKPVLIPSLQMAAAGSSK